MSNKNRIKDTLFFVSFVSLILVVIVLASVVYALAKYQPEPTIIYNNETNIQECQSSFDQINIQPNVNPHVKYHYTGDIGRKTSYTNLIIEDVRCIPLDGSSMQPTIFSKDITCYINYTGQKLSEGNIIVYADEDGNQVTHRITALYPDRIFLSGDNVPATETINYSQVRGILAATLYNDHYITYSEELKSIGEIQ